MGKRKLTVRKMELSMRKWETEVTLGHMKSVVIKYCMGVLGEHKKHLGTFLNLTNREGMGDRVWRQESDLLRRQI